MLMITTLAFFLPPAVFVGATGPLIPLHGVVQLGSNLGRAALKAMVRHVFYPIVPAFLAGTVLGGALGGQLMVSLPTPLLQV